MTRQADRRDRLAVFTPARRTRFVRYVEDNPGCTVKEAAAAAGVRRWQVKERFEADPEFRAAYDGARGNRRDKIREELWARAFDRKDPSSGRLLLKLAEAELPEHAPRQRLEHANADDKPFQTSHTFDPAKLTDEELATLEQMLAKARPNE